MRRARATAHANIALVKYWGKRAPTANAPRHLNLPAVGSLSMTLDGLRTETVVRRAQDGQDRFVLDGTTASRAQSARVFAHLDRVWAAAARRGARPPCAVESCNCFPTAAGLASSASGFAALTLASAAAFELDADRDSICTLARTGSGSAPRSLWGGFVRLDRGRREDGSDCTARQVQPASHWSLRMLVVRTAVGAKHVGSTTAMERCRETSPFYEAWVDGAEADLEQAERALAERDLAALGRVMEHSCCKMHAVMLAARPPVLYWNEATLAVMQKVWEARRNGVQAYVTTDAGPHVKVLCEADLAQTVTEILRPIPGVREAVEMGPGPDAFAKVVS